MRIIIIVLALLLAFPASQALARELTVYCEYQAPEDLPAEAVTPRGIIIYEIVREVMRRADVQPPILFASWKKGYSEATTGQNIGLFPTSRTAQREDLFHWIGPIMSVQWAFIARKSSKLSINSLNEARKVKRIGTYRHDAKEQWLEAQGFTNLVSSMDSQQNLKKLLHDRLDLMAGSPSAVRGWILQQGLDFDSEVRIVHIFREMDLYLALSKKTTPETVSAMQNAFADMVEDGTYKRIYQTNAPNLDIPAVR